jgi:hypothetical protein
MAPFDISRPHPQSLIWGGELLPIIDTACYGDPATSGAPPLPTRRRRNGGDATPDVFVRVRPLIEAELRAGAQPLAGMAERSSEPGAEPGLVVALETESGSTIGGYAGVLGPEASNVEVFERSFKEKLGTVARGGSASLFAYGYTGSGKSHTVLGYGEERGLYFLAAQELLERVGGGGAGDGGGGDGGGGDRFLIATAAEVYADQVFDLLGEERQPAELRTDAAGTLQVCGRSKEVEPGSLGVPELATALAGGGCNGGARASHQDADSGVPLSKLATFLYGADDHSTLITRTMGLRCAIVRRPEDLAAIYRSAVSLRSTGASTTHEQVRWYTPPPRPLLPPSFPSLLSAGIGPCASGPGHEVLRSEPFFCLLFYFCDADTLPPFARRAGGLWPRPSPLARTAC